MRSSPLGKGVVLCSTMVSIYLFDASGLTYSTKCFTSYSPYELLAQELNKAQQIGSTAYPPQPIQSSSPSSCFRGSTKSRVFVDSARKYCLLLHICSVAEVIGIPGHSHPQLTPLLSASQAYKQSTASRLSMFCLDLRQQSLSFPWLIRDHLVQVVAAHRR